MSSVPASVPSVEAADHNALCKVEPSSLDHTLCCDSGLAASGEVHGSPNEGSTSPLDAQGRDAPWSCLKRVDALPLEHLQAEVLVAARLFFERHAMWSPGSEAHVNSSCKPCRYFHTRRGCADGNSCNYCHMPHAHNTNSRHNRASKAKRLHCRRIVELLAGEFMTTANHGQASPVLQYAASQSSYMQTFLRQWLSRADSVCEEASGSNITGDLSSHLSSQVTSGATITGIPVRSSVTHVSLVML